MKKGISFILSFIILSFCLKTAQPLAFAEDPNFITVKPRVKYCQTEARTILDMINELRTGNDAWYWNETDTEKIYVNDLSALTYDYNLERIAMQRAAELALYYSHTRPDGTRCFSAYDQFYYAGGENIAAGYTSAVKVNAGWREDDEMYSGQGHRRNMLSRSFTAVGIGCVYYNGIYYWAEEFGTPVIDSEYKPAKDGEEAVEIKLADSAVTDFTYKLECDSYQLQAGKSITLPSGTLSFSANDTWPYGYAENLTAVPDWKSNNSDVAEIRDGTVYAKADGDTTLTAKFLNNEYTFRITVSGYAAGDINGDGTVNNKDLTRLFQYLSDWDVEVNEAALDINGDSAVNNKDLTRLFQYLSDWDVEIF